MSRPADSPGGDGRWAPPSRADREVYSPADVFRAGLRNHHIANTAYPIAHKTTWGPYRVRERERYEEVAERAWRGISDLCLYVHIPFCEVRCSFCEYTVVRSSEHDRTKEYVNDLLGEMELQAALLGGGDRLLHGLDIGGGTPSFLPAAEIERILDRIRSLFRFHPASDISIETTPKIAAADPEKIAAYREMGIDRISMGIQVIQPDLLKILNRSENGVDKHRRAVESVRRAGFERLNLDLMYGFADQTIESWRATLAHAISLEPEYITLYRMRYKLTRISHQADRVTLEQIRPMIRLAKELLSAAGYEATCGKTTWSRRPGDVGTSSYLAHRVSRGMPYLGLGLGAQTFTDTTISYNSGSAGKNLTPYRRDVAAGRLPFQDLYDLPLRQMAGKMCAVSFYFGEIDARAFERKFGRPLERVYGPAIEFLLARNLMAWQGRKLRLTPKGALHKNGVIPLFAAPSIQRYLLDRRPHRAEDLARNRRAALGVVGEG